MNKTFERVLVGLVAGSVFAAPFVTGAALANICGTPYGPYWRVTGFPTFKSGPPKATDYEVDASSPNRIMVTNGTAVMRTTDSACTWKQVYSLPAIPTTESQSTAANSRIVSIDISESKRDRVLLMVEEQAVTGARPHVIRSEDMGETWVTGDIGLPPQGAPEAIVLPRANGNLAYLAIDVGGGSIDFIFASTDGGATWTLRSNPASITPSMAITGFVVDPIDANSLWAWGAGLYHSTDGGASFTAVADFIGSTVSTADVYHGGGRPARIIGYKPLEGAALVSINGGTTWLSIDTPALVDSSAHGDGAAKGYITAAGMVHSFHGPTQAWINLQPPLAGVTDVSTDSSGIVYVRTGDALLSYDGPDHLLPGDVPDDVFEGGFVDPPQRFQPHQPALTPASKKVVLDPGESRTVTYDLTLSKTPLPVNVFFLLDTSDSMGATILDLAASVVDITNLLNKENFALEVGIGAFRAFPDHLPPRPQCGEETVPGQNCETNYVYRRVLDIAPASQALSDALETLESDAGGFYKSHLQALYTLATGERVDIFPPGEDSGDVDEGQGATFDADAYRVVINATDEAFWEGEARDGGGTDFGNPEPPPTPLYREVKEAFNAKQIYQVGLSIGPAPRKDLGRVARDTDALAPAGGVDCGKGHFLEEGDPLVCPVSRNNLTQSHNLVPAIVNLIENLPARVDVAYEARGNDRVVGKVTPERTPDVVLQVANDLGFEVTYRCPLDLAGKRFDIELSATNLEDAKLLDDAATQVVCRAKPKTPPFIPPIVAVSLVALAIPPPPPPPPPAQLTSASQAQSQAQAQTGAAFEEEKEPQLAVAAAYREAAQIENDYAYEMVAYEGRKQPVSPYLTLGAGAIMTSMAFAGMMIQRTRQNRRLALQPSRRGNPIPRRRGPRPR